ncbi:hypothetical protein OPT61_g1186 [Boeremia exigua]|uniref:Uncharacterized protein n=1 Tax=Boeremia exigua TaxID=749465 RepID=A0ACC2IQY7_9PLEO|nr:hypothetical protein OPT61_g1186 [Boeremia exigua]
MMRIRIGQDLSVEPRDTRSIDLGGPRPDIGISRRGADWTSAVAVVTLPSFPALDHVRNSIESAFWGLIPLALSAMTQPSGQVLQYPIQLRTYLRSSPVVCGFDALTLLIRFAAYLLTGCYSAPLHAAARAMQIRNRPQNKLGPNEGFQALENLPTVRWLVFCFGTLPQAVKITAFGGLYWTKAWGGLYLASFAIMECFIIAGNRGPYQMIEEDDDDAPEEAIRNISKPKWMANALQRLEDNLALFESFCGIVALLLQLAYLGWVFWILLRPHMDFKDRLKDHDDAATVVVWIPIIYFAVFVYLLLAWVCLALPSGYGSRGCRIMLSLIAGVVCITAYPVALVVLFTSLEKSKAIETLTEVFITVLAYLGSLVALWIGGETLAVGSLLRYKVLLIHREHRRKEEKKGWAIAAWSMFAATLSLSMCYYAFRYDPSGTYKPKWTNSIG